MKLADELDFGMYVEEADDDVEVLFGMKLNLLDCNGHVF